MKHFIETPDGNVEIEPFTFAHAGGGPHRSCESCLALVRDDELVHAAGCGAARMQSRASMILERKCNHCGHVDHHTLKTETSVCGGCGTEANPVQHWVSIEAISPLDAPPVRPVYGPQEPPPAVTTIEVPRSHVVNTSAGPIACIVDGRILWKCTSNDCWYVARHEVYWPGQTNKSCNACLAKGKAIATAMGFDLQSKELDVPTIGDDDSATRFSLMELT